MSDIKPENKPETKIEVRPKPESKETKPENKSKPGVETQLYPLDEILANAETLFCFKAEVVRGALHGNAKEELTIDEVRQAINSFLKRRAK